MKPTLAASLVLVTLLGPGLAYAAAPDPALPAVAPPTAPPPAAPPAPAPAAAPSTASEASNARNIAADRAAFFEARLAALHAGLTLTPAQEALWPPLERAVRSLADLRRAEFRAMMMQRRGDADQNAKGEEPQTSQVAPGSAPFDRLKETGARLEQHGKALQALADAAQPMFASLSPDQTRRLPMLLQGLVPQRGPITRMMTSLGVAPRQGENGMGGHMGRLFQGDDGTAARGRDRSPDQDGPMESRPHGPMAGDEDGRDRGSANWSRNDDERGSERYGDTGGRFHQRMGREEDDHGHGGWHHSGPDGWNQGRDGERDGAYGQRQDRSSGMMDRERRNGADDEQTSEQD